MLTAILCTLLHFFFWLYIAPKVSLWYEKQLEHWHNLNPKRSNSIQVKE